MLEHIAILLVLLYSLIHAIRHFKHISLEQYLHNEKSTGLLLSTASAVAGNVGAGTVVGIFAFAAKGKGVALYISVCYAAGLLLTGLLAGWVYRRNHALGANSFIDFIVLHFGKQTKPIVWGAVGCIFFLQMASQLLALGSILHASLDISLGIAILYAYAIVTLYMLSGGYYSVTRTDLLQFGFLFATAVLIVCYFQWEPLLQNLSVLYTPQNYGPVFILGILLFFAPTAVISIDNWHRVISAESAGVARKAFFITSGICLFIYLAYTLLGLTADPSVKEPVGLMKQLFPKGLSFFAILSLLMAVVSTMDSTILPLAAPVCSSVKSNRLLAMRLVVWGIMTGIALVAYFLGSVITGLIAALSSLVALFPPVLTALFDRPASALALQISLPASILSSLFFVTVNEEYAFLVGIGVSFVLYYGISYLDLRRKSTQPQARPE